MSSEEVCCAKARTRNDTNISSTIRELSEEPRDERLSGFLNSSINEYGSKGWLVQKLLEAGRIGPERAEDILTKSEYSRYGFVFHPRRKNPASYNIAKAALNNEQGPITFFDYEMEDLEHEIGSFIEVIAIPLTRVQSCRISSIHSQVYNILHRLMAQAGLLGSKVGRRYSMRSHSIRKFFRTQMAALGASTDYIEYMMGHTISTYHDIRMKGIEFLRARYAAAGLCIKQKEKSDIYDFVEDVLKSKGYSIDRELLRRAMIEPHRTIVGPKDYREERKTIIRDEFMRMLRKELLDTKAV